MATTRDYIATTSSQYAGAGFPRAGNDKFFVLERTVNVATAATDLGVSAWVANDVLKIIDIPAKTLIIGISCKIDTAAGTTSSTLDIGDGDDPNGWEDGMDATSTDTHIFSLTYANGGTVTDKDNGYYASADTIDVVLADVVWTTGVFTVRVACVDLS